MQWGNPFIPFERIGAEKTNVEGTGLGLAVVKQLIDLMGGKVGVQCKPGEGSTCWIELQQCENHLDQTKRNQFSDSYGSKWRHGKSN